MATSTESLTLLDNANPLRQYRSYSYHFFMIAAESTAVLDYLLTASSDAFERPSGNPRQTIGIQNVGNYVIVVDTRRDVDFILDDVQWGTTFVGDQNSSKSTIALNTVMTDGCITVLEPRGVNFLNVLANLGDQLNVDMICMPYMLKVIFYGHTEDGQMIPLSAVQPLGFVPVDITATVDERGTAYKMDICGVINGIVYNPSFNAIVDNIGFTIKPGKLVDVLAQLSEKLNDTYKAQRQQVITSFHDSIDLSGAATIVYQIILESGSEQLQYLDDFGSNTPAQVTTQTDNCIITGTKEGGIAEVILKLLQSSKKWMTVAAQGSPPNITGPDNVSKRYTFKVTSVFEKTSTSLGQNIVTVKIFVSEYRYETVDVISTAGGSRTVQQTPKISADQVVTFDYIFTGKNLDILHMDLNLSMGLALLQTLALSKALSSQKEDVTGGQAPRPGIVPAASPASGGVNRHGTIRKGTPIFAPLQWAKEYQKELNSVQESATADAIWSSFAGYQSINTNVTIHGNPLLLGKLVNPNRTVPNYVKINIKMPSTTDDIWEYNQSGNSTPGGYYTDFWFTGYYLLLSATNKFKDGMFTQDLELISMPQVSSSQGQVASAETSQDQNLNVRDYFTPQVSQSTPTTTITPNVLSDITKPKTISAVGSLATPSSNPASSTHQQFIANYWNYALQASQTSGIDPDFVLAQAAVETGWGNNHLSQNYSNFFGARSYNKPNAYWSGAVVPGSGTEAGNKVPPFRAYDGPTNSFLDQSDLLTRLYPTSASAPEGPSGINQYANGLIAGKGGRTWTATNPSSYPPQVISAYNQIQTFKSNLGIVANNYFGTPPTAPGTPAPYLAQNVVSISSSVTTSTTSQYATNRTIIQASIDQKKTRTV